MRGHTLTPNVEAIPTFPSSRPSIFCEHALRQNREKKRVGAVSELAAGATLQRCTMAPEIQTDGDAPSQIDPAAQRGACSR